MPKIASKRKRTPPPSFRQHSRDKFQRTVQLTQSAITQLEAQGQTVTLAAICEATSELDEQRKGLKPMTILRNAEAAELFRQHSPVYQARQQQVQKARPSRRSKARTGQEAQAIYRGLRSSDLIQMLETLKTQMVELKTQQEKLTTERDEAYRLRDEALEQNARQLAALTTLKNKLPATTTP